MDLAKLGFEVDTAGLRRGQQGLKGLNSSTRQVDDSAQRATGSVQALGNVARIAIAAIGGLTLGRVINQTADFEQAMLGVRAVTRATADEYQILTDQARELGATTVFSAQQAADAQRFLAQAGFEVNEVLSATPGVIQLAVAAGLELGEAADLASNALSGFRLEVNELGRVNDVLANTAASANTDVRQLGQALSFAAPIASSAGVSIEETAAAIGALSDAGLQASRAGTGLVGFIRQLSKITPQASETLSKYGIELSDIDITTRGLQPVMETLADANISVADSFEIFGSEAGAAAQVLLGTSERVDELTASNREATGAAEEMADVMGSGLRASIKSLNSAASEAVLQLGEGGLGSSMAFLIRQATGVLSVYNGMLPQFAEANDLTEEQAENFELTAIALKSVGAGVAVIGGLTVALRAATVAQIAFNAAARVNPYILLASAITAAGTALYSLIDATDDTAERTRLLNQEVDQLTEGYGSLTKAQAENELQSVSNALSETRRETMQARIELQRLQETIENSGQLTPQGGALPVATAEDINRARQLKEQIEDSERGAEALWQAYEKAGDRLEELNNRGDDGGRTGGGVETVPGEGDVREKMERRREALLQSLETEKQAILRAYGERDAEISALEDARLLSEMEAANARVQNEREKQNSLTDLTRQGEEQRLETERQAAERRVQVQNNLNGQIIGQAANFTSNLAGLVKKSAGEQSNAYKAAFLAQQGFAIASTIVNAELAATSALAPPPIGLGPLAGAPYAATIRGMGYASAGIIAAQTIGEMASFDGGGYTGNGSRSGGMDGKGGFLAMMHPRETVVDHTKGGNTSSETNVTQVFQLSDNARREAKQQILESAPMIRSMAKQAVLEAIGQGGSMSRAVGRRS